MISVKLNLFLVYVHEVDDWAVLCGEHALAVPRDHRVRNDTYIICPLESGKDLFRITENDRQSGCAECRIELNRFFCPVLSGNQEIVTARMRGRYFLGHFATPYFPIQGLPIMTYREVDMGAVPSSDDFPGMASALLTGLNFREGATAIERNTQIGGHRAG